MKELIEPEVDENSLVTLQKVTADNFSEICLLSHTLSEAQRNMVADNAFYYGRGAIFRLCVVQRDLCR